MPDRLFRFKQEFRLHANLHHPNLVTLYELVADGEPWFFTMEYVAGVDFLKYVRAENIGRAGPALLDDGAYARLRTSLRQLAEGPSASARRSGHRAAPAPLARRFRHGCT